MSSDPSGSGSTSPNRGRGRGKSRGGLGKYLRARGRGGGRGRPAEFHTRLVLEDEELIEVDPESEEAKEMERKYSRRQLGSNADRYKEPEPVLNSDGEIEEEPEVDLTVFLARQRSEPVSAPLSHEQDEDDVDTSLAHLAGKSPAAVRGHKGKLQEVEWTEEMEEIRREKEVADANRELKAKFRVTAEKQKSRSIRPNVSSRGKGKDFYVEAPPLPYEIPPLSKGEKEKMEDFLDDLLG